MFLLHLSILFAVSQAFLEINGCGENGKKCLKVPANCVGERCWFGYSTIVEGDSMEVEILSDLLTDNFSSVTAYYSLDGTVPVNSGEIDYRLVCHRNITIANKENLDPFYHETVKRLQVEVLDIKTDNNWIVCKFRHSAEPLNNKKPTIYMSRGILSQFDIASWYNIGTLYMSGKGLIDTSEPEINISQQSFEKLMNRLEVVEESMKNNLEASERILEAFQKFEQNINSEVSSAIASSRLQTSNEINELKTEIESLKSLQRDAPLNDPAKLQNDIKVESSMVSDKKPTSYDYNIMIQLGLPNRFSK